MVGNEAGEIRKDQLMEAGPCVPCLRNSDLIKANERHLGREKNTHRWMISMVEVDLKKRLKRDCAMIQMRKYAPFKVAEEKHQGLS